MRRTILHVDLDAFYASVEQRDDPSLRGRPVIVGGHAQRGVVCAASYEARPFGVRSAMSMVEALRRCPQAVVLPVRMDHYADVSREFFTILDRWSPLVEGLSLDEAFLDVTGQERLHGDGPTIAARIKSDVRDELRLVASVGVAPCKFVAKIASDLGKPDGLVAVDDVIGFLHPLPAARLWGVGRVTEAALDRLGLRTIGDVARAGAEYLRPTVGSDSAQHLVDLARGIDDRAVISDRAPVSVGAEDTFDRDVHDRADLAPHILAQTDRSCARVRALGLRARTVTLKIKYADHRLITRRVTFERATSDGRRVGAACLRLLEAVPDVERRGVRLTGVSLSGLADKAAPQQLDLDEAEVARGEALGETLDKIADRFGSGVIKRGVNLKE